MRTALGWILGGLVGAAGAFIACSNNYSDISNWAHGGGDGEWPLPGKYFVFFVYSSIVAALGAWPGVMLGLLLGRAERATVLAWTLAGPSAFAAAFALGTGSAWGAAMTVLSLPNFAIIGGCVGASAGGLLAMLWRWHLGAAFAGVFGGGIGSALCLVYYLITIGGRVNKHVPRDPHQLWIDGVAFALIVAGAAGGVIVRFMKALTSGNSG